MKHFASGCALLLRVLGYSLVTLLLSIASPVCASADTFTYNYTGFSFSVWFNSQCPPECNLTGSITFAQPLPSNLPWATPLLGVDVPLSYSFTDGVNTYTSANSTFELLYGSAACGSVPCVGTGPAENMTYWSFALVNTAGLQMISQAYPVCNIYGCGTAGYDSIIINTLYGANVQAGSDAPGSWSGPIETIQTPEPTGLVLFGIAVVGVVRRGLRPKRLS